jgi:uncharacterized protein (TIGR02246 family)
MDELQRLLIESACRTLVLRAAACADANEPARLAAWFTDDATLVRPNAQPLQGRQAIQQAYAQRPAGRITRHLVTHTLVEVESAAVAHAHSCVLLWAGSLADEPGPQGRPAQPRQVLGEFDDRCVLTPAGWRIARRDARFVLHTGD